jgi:hypothetical protein
VEDSSAQAAPDGAALAPVIRLPRPHPSASSAEAARRDAEQARLFLERRYGGRWVDVPADLGRRALQAEQLLTTGPTALVSDAVMPADALATARTTVRAAGAVGQLLTEETEILGEVLGSDLGDLPLRRLTILARSIVELGSAPPADPGWADPRAADAAEIVLQAFGSRLLDSREQHERVYRWFTERVWEIPERWLRSGRHPWRVIRCIRLTHALRTVSREGRRQPLRHSVDLLLRARSVRTELEVVAPMLTGHLGIYDRGPLTDVSRAGAALAAVRDLHDALGHRVSVERLTKLLASQAFAAGDVIAPASTILSVLAAWESDLTRIGVGSGGTSLTAAQLTRWADDTEIALETLNNGLRAAEGLGVRPMSLRELVNDLLARERLDELDPRLASRPASALGASNQPGSLAEALPPLDPEDLRALTTNPHGVQS